ncbi:PolC-type DNA polymerase III [Alkaliphilus hydrothermalis]|uniref:DNA polymerase III PolC-type n=1 Tax=Alkaliphilus hydrothermalis TaxID=1482730 RepID=A0ABS2NL95_9FIRM|nr:PolC-type DNA polymerase III [Alkaliphilus hydrothermalis]MBM7613702.1 DNA polymerase-3 subunit alpha (Gram-positive type) [Alkaliphilus hydrothermalis]
MQSNLDICFSDFLGNLGIKGYGSFKSYQLKRVRFFKEKRKLELKLASDQVTIWKELDNISEKLKGLLQVSELSIDFIYHFKIESIPDIIEKNRHNILYFIQRLVPATRAILDRITWKVEEEKFIIHIPEPMLWEKAVERNLKQVLEDYFLTHFGVKIVCNIEGGQEGSFDLADYEEVKEKKSTQYIDEIMRNIQIAEVNEAKSAAKKEVNGNSPALLGKPFSGEITPLKEIVGEMIKIICEGETIAVETRELNSGKKLYTIQFTDYTSSMMVKIFERKNNTVDFEEEIKKGQWFRVQGDVVYDKFAREYVIMASALMLTSKEPILDTYESKRVELHLHTQMSSMDGVSSTTSLVKRAAEWGHKAIAITDHGIVQAFPEAMDAGKKHGIKIIYGMEGYLVNDEAKLVEGNENYSLEEEFIVFDIETTGLSNKRDKITEIGAVKVKNGEVIDQFSSLINPEMPIPQKIVDLTGITDDMVKDAPLIEDVLPKFLNFVGNNPLVAHNASFDVGFIRENARQMGITITNSVVDTLKLARILLPQLKKHKLNVIAKELNVTLLSHHRAVDDATATAEIWMHFIKMLQEKEIFTFDEINQQLTKKLDFKKLDTYHVLILVKNYEGLRNLYDIVSQSHINYFYKKPRLPKSLLSSLREGLIVGTACEAGELYQALLNNKPEDEIESIVHYYDFLEIQPAANNQFLVDKGILNSVEDIRNINKRIVELGEKHNKPVVATGDVHFLEERDEVFRRILMAGQGFSDADNQAPLYLKTTTEMVKEFSYLGKEKAEEVVIHRPNELNDQIEELIPIPNGTFPPEIEGSEVELRNMCNAKAERIYGSPIPDIVKKRLDKELNSIISNGYAVMYIIAQKLVTKSMEDGYLVGSRGSVGSSFAATMSDITEVNPLPPHYVCPECKHSEFITDGSYGSGADLPDKKCPKCDHQLIKDGHDIPFEVFLGFEGDKEPDIDLNFAGEYQSESHKYTEELFGEGKVYRAGTIGTIAEKTAYGFVRKYLEAKGQHVPSAEINRLTIGCSGVKRTSGQHPGGVMIVPANKHIYEFCPIQYPANDGSSGVITTHFDYHSISGRLLKLDILGHDVPTIIKMLEDLTGENATLIPLDDPETISIFTSTKAIGVDPKELNCDVGTLGIPEFGTKFVRQMLLDTKPSTFAELVRISGLSHGTDVWLNNAQELVRNGVAELKDVISTRDDIMNYLILKGLPAKMSFKIMENVRKGKGLTDEHIEEMKKNNVPQWYIDSCLKIKYMFPKAHAAAYVMMSFRIAYFKVHHPKAFYATYFTTKAEDFDADLVVKGKDAVKRKIKELEEMGNDMTAKEKNLLTVLEVVLEMYLRNIEVMPVDIYRSDSDRFQIVDCKLLPPLKSLQGVGQNAAKNIVEARKDGEFISLEDLRNRTKVTKTVIETLVNHGCISDLPATNQLSLF